MCPLSISLCICSLVCSLGAACCCAVAWKAIALPAMAIIAKIDVRIESSNLLDKTDGSFSFQLFSAEITVPSLRRRLARLRHPVTPDGRYFVVRGKLWRLSDLDLDPREKSRLVNDLMAARRAVKDAKSAGDHGAESEAHRMVDEAKRALGERGPVWWKGRSAGPQQARRKEHALR